MWTNSWRSGSSNLKLSNLTWKHPVRHLQKFPCQKVRLPHCQATLTSLRIVKSSLTWWTSIGSIVDLRGSTSEEDKRTTKQKNSMVGMYVDVHIYMHLGAVKHSYFNSLLHFEYDLSITRTLRFTLALSCAIEVFVTFGTSLQGLNKLMLLSSLVMPHPSYHTNLEKSCLSHALQIYPLRTWMKFQAYWCALPNGKVCITRFHQRK